MIRSNRTIRATVAAVAVIALGSISGASTALAVPTYSGTAPFASSGSLTLKLAGGSPVTCTVSASPWLYTVDTWFDPCAGGTQFRMYVAQVPAWNGGAPYMTIQPYLNGAQQSPWGNWSSYQIYQVPVTNGNASTPTKMTFNNTQIGVLTATSQPITATGTLNITSTNGSLVTIVP